MALSASLPPAPALPQNLIDQVFTHRSLLGLAATATEYDVGGKDNEALAFLGSAIIEMIAALFVCEAFPDSRRSILTPKRAQLIELKQVSQWAIGYRFHERIAAVAPSVLNIQSSPKMQSQVFQAYVGAVYKSELADVEGFRKAKEWLYDLLALPLYNNNDDSTDSSSDPSDPPPDSDGDSDTECASSSDTKKTTTGRSTPTAIPITAISPPESESSSSSSSEDDSSPPVENHLRSLSEESTDNDSSTEDESSDDALQDPQVYVSTSPARSPMSTYSGLAPEDSISVVGLQPQVPLSAPETFLPASVVSPDPELTTVVDQSDHTVEPALPGAEIDPGVTEVDDALVPPTVVLPVVPEPTAILASSSSASSTSSSSASSGSNNGNSVGILNELHSRKKLVLSWASDINQGTDHSPKWYSTLIVDGKTYYGTNDTKKKARADAAASALAEVETDRL
ncbi:hypothetical protein SISNIDRAFT_483187 [Sistotremastrum niveocremeum HHB9708]|uniref:Uncharacterized protein n=1 Tax=Sistotremastrum niveocremeum HHB9708 TaxID=1314777 RepID=A0A164X9E4_9AGAM|nr:hypothetical protein SISNIDRAFT_483187 [Sistotremastrum niveocremeum HHB9708]